MDVLWIWGFVLVCLFEFAVGEYCHERYYSYYAGYQARKIHCSFGCCGPTYDEYCCVSNAGIIVGIIFAAIFGLALLTAITCCFIKKKNQRGRVIQPAHRGDEFVGPVTSNIFIVPSGAPPPAYSSQGYTQPYSPYAGYSLAPSAPVGPGYSQPGGAPVPPAYSQAAMPPPAYSYDPAYPPQGGAYSPQGGAYPPQGGAFPPQGGAFPPQGGAFPPGTSGAPGGAYPPQGNMFGK